MRQVSTRLAAELRAASGKEISMAEEAYLRSQHRRAPYCRTCSRPKSTPTMKKRWWTTSCHRAHYNTSLRGDEQLRADLLPYQDHDYAGEMQISIPNPLLANIKQHYRSSDDAGGGLQQGKYTPYALSRRNRLSGAAHRRGLGGITTSVMNAARR